jgi:hypothetical protein
MICKKLVHCRLTGRLDYSLLLALPLGAVGGWNHAQHLVELVYRYVDGAVSNVLVDASESAG